MPRKPREKSPNNLYHIVFRGTNKQILFESKYDYLKYLDIMQNAKKQIGFEIHAYCLMSNHVHMLVKIPFENLPKISLCINSPYAHFYNLKYCRTGHLFEIRYGSIPVKTIHQYLNTIRYIHQNPVHAGLINNNNTHKYPWSSMREFIKYAESNHEVNHSFLSNPNIVAEVFESTHESEHKTKNRKFANFLSFHSTVAKDCAYEHDKFRLTDQEAAEVIKNQIGHKVEFLKDAQKMDIEKRNEIISEMKKNKLSITQISRLTGIGRNIIQRVKVGE